MGVLSDLVVAGEGDASQILHTLNPSAELGGIDIKGIDAEKFAALHAIVSGRPLEEVIGEYDPIAWDSDEGPWVFRISQELVVQLAQIGPGERARVAAKWAETEEFRFEDWDTRDVSAVLDEISKLAVRAASAGRAMFLWMSL